MRKLREKTVLLVEDTPEDIELIRRIFSKHAVPGALEIVSDSTLVMDSLREREQRGEPRPELILLDLKLSKITGIEILKKLRSNAYTAPAHVVILTSSEEERDVSDAYAAGATSYVVKPVDFTLLCELIRLTCSYWLTLNVPPPRSY